MPEQNTAKSITQWFDEASRHGVPPYNWVPPEWPKTGVGPDPSTPPVFEDTVKAPDTYNSNDPKLDCDVVTHRQLEDHPGQDEADDHLTMTPHPKSSFEHDETKPHSIGMKRLGLVFEWALCKVQGYLKELDFVVNKKPDPKRYAEVREAYINFLKDMDDKEPKVVKPGKAGYGRALKWFHVFPVIHQGRIQGMRVVGVWNPHSSSSGVPVPHIP